MKIYFAGSIRGGREYKQIYFQIIKYLEKYGQVLTEHIGNKHLSELGEKDLSDKLIYERDISWIQEADIIIAEVSTPSLGVGYELRVAEELNKKILCLFKSKNGKRLSAMIAGNKKLRIIYYKNLKEAIQYIDNFFKEII